MLLTTPLTEHCAAPLRSGVHVCVGVSPFNSYFTVERITALARWALREFESFHFFVPDQAAVYTLEALGYDPGRAQRKAARQGQYVVNKICRALRDVGVDYPEHHLLDGSALARNEMYRELLRGAHAWFMTDDVFAQQCLDATRWVLDRRLPDGQAPTDEQLHCAVRYFLAELPMFIDTPAIARVESSVFAYHQRVAFLERLYARELAWVPNPAQGFVVLRPGDEAA
ncbi:tRNA-dependent cyclodipeptide synthase [Lentzea guizhouensis]|uniref:Cyclodipeptide synthase n=1 Tax=Lentzea guizhouensis TaxID=1586287 RepID=A0A1B2HUU5_9PSEU|nr:tRNA-dependent cyclodipeptide synthase [Lentzea guizhouensis]ANZ41516.1 tRNA-dependent cyclodipeptide synthase [Lentzea guizhouensis]